MYNTLSKYNLITILPFGDTFFHAVFLPKKLKFTKELLSLNYSKYSPYQNPTIISLLQNQNLMLWFYKKKADSLIVIPESYAIFKELNLNKQDAIYIIKEDDIKVLIIKNEQLINVFTLDKLDEGIITLSMDEAQVSTRVEIGSVEYQRLKSKAFNSLTIKEFYNFNTLELDKKVLLNKLINKASYPIAFFVVFAIFVSYVHDSMLEAKIEKLKDIYKIQKDTNKDIKSYIKEHNKEVKKYKTFIARELTFREPMGILSKVYTIFKKEDKAYLVDISINEDKLLLRIQTDINPVTFLNRLNEIKEFSRVVIQNTYKPKNQMKIIYYEIQVKKSKEL